MRRRSLRDSFHENRSWGSLRSHTGDSYGLGHVYSTKYRFMGQLWSGNGESKPAFLCRSGSGAALRGRSSLGLGLLARLSPGDPNCARARADSQHDPAFGFSRDPGNGTWFIEFFNRRHLERRESDPELAARIKSFET